MARRITISAGREPVVTVQRRAVRNRKLVYVICTPRAQKYAKGRSRIIYIGTTASGVHRVAASAANKAIDFLKTWGVKYLDVYLITCPPRPGVKSWSRLEKDLLIAFQSEYGQIPAGNKSGKNFRPDKLSRLFNYNRLCKILRCYASS